MSVRLTVDTMGETSLNDSNVKVAVRVRPMNRREKDLNTKCIVDMEGNQTILHPGGGNLGKGDSRSQTKTFAYDYCFWSMDESEKDKFAGQFLFPHSVAKRYRTLQVEMPQIVDTIPCFT